MHVVDAGEIAGRRVRDGRAAADHVDARRGRVITSFGTLGLGATGVFMSVWISAWVSAVR